VSVQPKNWSYCNTGLDERYLLPQQLNIT
jgi:hypothetical protein